MIISHNRSPPWCKQDFHLERVAGQGQKDREQEWGSTVGQPAFSPLARSGERCKLPRWKKIPAENEFPTFKALESENGLS